MRRSAMSAAMLAKLAGRSLSAVPVWSVQPLQQHFGEGDDEGGDGGDEGGDDDGGDNGGGDDGGGGGGDEGGEGGDDGGDDGQDEKLGPAGKRALDRVKARFKKEREKSARLERENADLKAGKSGGSGGDEAERAQREFEAQVIARTNARLLKSEVRARAAGHLTDPGDAVRFLDLSEFEVDEDGNVDEDEIDDAIKKLVEDKPYLAAQGGKRHAPRRDRRQGGNGGRKVSGKDVGVAEARKRFGAGGATTSGTT